MPPRKKPAEPPKAIKNPGRTDKRFALLGVEISSPLKAALDRCATETGRRKRFMIEKAIEAYLRAEGFWPPPTSP